MFKYLGVIGFLLIATTTSKAQELTIGIESFPPVFDKHAQGVGTDLLKRIEQVSDLTFNLQIMTYARAKKELQNQRIDIIGLIPKGLETKDFYQYAIELDWYFNNSVEVFSTEKKYLKLNSIPVNSLGTLVGNAAFFSEKFNIPLNKFVEVASLEQLVKMLDKKRLKAILFERAAVMSSIQNYINTPIYYRYLDTIPATLAVAKTKEGRQLKKMLDSLIIEVNQAQNFQKRGNYYRLPNFGIVPNIHNNQTDSLDKVINAYDE
ncbi:hypothetical protein ACOYR1_13425 [Thalassotalea piscium]